MPDQPNTKFDAEARAEYVEYLRRGNLKYESARLVGVSYRTVERHRKDDDEFRKQEHHALAEAREGIEKVLYDMARQGDIGAIDRWLKAHDRSTYGDKKTLELDATPAALEMSRNELAGKVTELQQTLAERRARLIESGDIIDAESEEVQETALPVAPPDDDTFTI